jgi:hypothetical protein
LELAKIDKWRRKLLTFILFVISLSFSLSHTLVLSFSLSLSLSFFLFLFLSFFFSLSLSLTVFHSLFLLLSLFFYVNNTFDFFNLSTIWIFRSNSRLQPVHGLTYFPLHWILEKCFVWFFSPKLKFRRRISHSMNERGTTNRSHF